MERDIGTYEHETEVLKTWWDTRGDKIYECMKILDHRHGGTFKKYRDFIQIKQRVMCEADFWPFEDGRELNDYYWIEIKLEITPIIKKFQKVEKEIEKLGNNIERCIGILEEFKELGTLFAVSSAKNLS